MNLTRLLRAFGTFIAIATVYICVRGHLWTFYATAAFLLALLIKEEIPGHDPSCSSSRSMFDDEDSCKAILACTFGGSSGKALLPSMLQARALPNKRLQIAFGIDNAFTTTDVSWYKEFRKLSESHLRVSNAKWTSLANTARRIAAKGVLHNSRSLALAPLVQLLTLKISLQLFFGLDAATLDGDDERIGFIASEINRIWIASKQQPDAIRPWHQQHELIDALRAVIPDHDPLTPKENPMNLILPSYETMWRVVLRCLIEVRFRRNNRNVSRFWQSALAAFLDDPTPGVLNNVVATADDAGYGDRDGVSAAAISKEALRLYPPTRRVYRDLPSTVGQGDTSPLRVAADIEALHRDNGSGGTSAGIHRVADACIFWPQRWIEAGSNSTSVGPFLAFGGARFICPASAAFGPLMVALLVAALSDALRGEFEIEGGGYAAELMDGKPLSSDREAYGDLSVLWK